MLVPFTPIPLTTLATAGYLVTMKEKNTMRDRLLKLLNEHKDQLAIAPELIVDQLMERYSENDALDDVANCKDEYWWDRYGLPYLMQMTVKVFAR